MNAEASSDIRASAPELATGPVSGAERFFSLDALRGVAVLGILVMNIYAFAMPFNAYTNPLAMGGTDPLNLGTWFFTHILFDQKFMSIFSMMFGAGIVLMSERAKAKGAKFGRIFYRRSLWLLVIGLIHAYLIWFGDILFFYAAVGMIVYLFRNLSPRTLIITGCLVLPVALLVSYAGGVYMVELKARAEALEQQLAAGETLSEEDQATVDEWTEARGFMLPGSEELEKDLVAYSGDYIGILKHRAPFVSSFQFEGLPFFILWRVGGLMLIGMGLMKLGVFSGARDARFYRNLMLVGYILGLPLTIYSSVNLYAHQFDALYTFKVGTIPNYFGSVLVSFGHVGLVMLITTDGALRSLLDRFAAVGRTALSNYLMHSVVMTTLFYGYGIGLYGMIPRFWQMAFVAGLIGVQLLLSPWWLARYRFGPVEWLWRSATYWQWQPMR